MCWPCWTIPSRSSMRRTQISARSTAALVLSTDQLDVVDTDFSRFSKTSCINKGDSCPLCMRTVSVGSRAVPSFFWNHDFVVPYESIKCTTFAQCLDVIPVILMPSSSSDPAACGYLFWEISQFLDSSSSIFRWEASQDKLGSQLREAYASFTCEWYCLFICHEPHRFSELTKHIDDVVIDVGEMVAFTDKEDEVRLLCTFIHAFIDVLKNLMLRTEVEPTTISNSPLKICLKILHWVFETHRVWYLLLCLQ